MKVFYWFCALIVVLLLGMLLYNTIWGAAFVDNTYEPQGEISDIVFDTSTADVRVLLAEDGGCRVLCHERENQTHSVTLEDGTLTVSVVDERKWYEHLGVFGQTTVTVYLPSTEFSSFAMRGKTGDVDLADAFSFGEMDVYVSTGTVTSGASTVGKMKIRTSTGRVHLDGVSAESIDVSVSTGDVTLSSVRTETYVHLRASTGDVKIEDLICESLVSEADTGDIEIKGASVTARLFVERSTGDVSVESASAGEMALTADTGRISLQSCEAKTLTATTSTGDITLSRSDAQTITIEADTGDVRGTLLSDKIFITKTSTGRVRVPDATAGGVCRVTTSTGDIEFEIVEQ